MNREQWLEKAVVILRDGMFKENDAVVPDLKVATGFPGSGLKRTTIGVYYPIGMTENKIPQVYISPVLQDPIKVLATLVHELIHAVVPEAKHGKPFGVLARKLGLEGKLTATVAGEALKVKLNDMLKVLGNYPHGAIIINEKNKQEQSLYKVICKDCDFVVRITRKQLDVHGTSICPCNNLRMILA